MAAAFLAVISLCIYECVSAEGQTNITANPGETTTLTCRAGHNGDIDAVEWIRPDLEPEYVYLNRDDQSDPDHQHPSFQNRVDLQDRQMKDGDVSLILKNLTTNDTGTYECRVLQRGRNRRKRANLSSDPISIIHLDVNKSGTTQDRRIQDGGDKDGGDKVGGDKDRGHYGWIVGLSAAGIIGMIVGFWISKRVQKKNSALLQTQSDLNQ